VIDEPNHRALPRRTAADTEGNTQRVLGKLENSDRDLTIQKLLANSGSLFRPFILISSALLFDSVVPRQTIEILILWLARELDVPYEWSEHVSMALAAGVSQSQIDAIASAEVDSELFSGEHLLAIDIARHLLAARTVPAETFRASVQTWEVSGTLDLFAVIGWWGGMVRTLIDGLGLVRPDGAAAP